MVWQECTAITVYLVPATRCQCTATACSLTHPQADVPGGGRLVVRLLRAEWLQRAADLLTDTFVDTLGVEPYRHVSALVCPCRAPCVAVFAPCVPAATCTFLCVSVRVCVVRSRVCARASHPGVPASSPPCTLQALRAA
jgi:hypothetical protein